MKGCLVMAAIIWLVVSVVIGVVLAAYYFTPLGAH